MESSLSTQALECCFWAMGCLKREAISKCSDRTHAARFPPWDPILSCLNMMLPCVHCDMTIWLCKSSLQSVNTHSQGWLICTAYLAKHTGTKLQYTIFTRTHFPTTQFQTEKHVQALLSTSGKDKYLCSQQQNKEQEGMNLSPVSGGKRKQRTYYGPPPPPSITWTPNKISTIYVYL